MEAPDFLNYSHASKDNVIKAFKTVRLWLDYYEKQAWIFQYIPQRNIKQLHSAIFGVIEKVKKCEGFYGYYTNLRDMNDALNALGAANKSGDNAAKAKACGNVLVAASQLVATIPLAKIYAEPIRVIGQNLETIVNKIGPTRGDKRYDEFFK